MPDPAPFRVGLLLYGECMPAGLFAFSDLLHAANRRAGKRIFETLFLAAEAGDVQCAHGQPMVATGAVEHNECDAILVPGFWAEAPQQIVDAIATHAPLIRALARLPKRVMMWSYCTGVCLVAATGRLNGQNATVTWWLADLVRTHFTTIHWQTEQTSIFNLRTATASGVSGYLPIAQSLIERRISTEAYRDLTKLMVLPRPENGHPVFQAMSSIEQGNILIRKLHAIAEVIPASEVTVGRVAGALNTTGRTLARKVSAATGLSIANYLRRIKLNQVSERLIVTSVPASTISEELGFSSDSNMRRMFKELTALTPAEYRLAFGRR